MTTTKALAEAREALSRIANYPHTADSHVIALRNVAREALAQFDAQAAEQAAGGGEAVGEMKLSELIDGLVIPVVTADLPLGTKLYTHPAPAAPVQPVGEREAFEAWAGREYRHAYEVTLQDYEHGWRAWKARAALTQPVLSEAEIDALRRDAERYRAVRDDDCHPYGICIWDEDDGWAQDARKPDVVDAAIDAALAARGEKR